MSESTPPSLDDAVQSLFSSTNAASCNRGTFLYLTFFNVWLVSIFFCIFFFVVRKREKLCQECCFGRPGLPVPIDFLVSPRSRFIYALLFGYMAYSFLITFQNLDVSLPGSNIYVTTFNKILWNPFITVSTQVLEFFPLFTAVEFHYQLVGYVTGLIYSIVWFAFEWVPNFIGYYNYSQSCGTTTSDSITIIITVFKELPLFIMAAVIVGWYFYKLVRHCLMLYRRRRTTCILVEGKLDGANTAGLRKYHLDHVKNLLKKDNVSKKTSVLRKALYYIFPFNKNYKLPVTLLGAITAMVMLAYQFSLILIVSSLSVLIQLSEVYSHTIKSLVNQVNASSVTTFKSIIGTLYIGLPVVMVLAPVLSLLLGGFLLIHMVASISKTMKSVAKHGFQGNLPPRHLRLSAYWKYLGVQIGLFFVAWVLYYIVFLIVGLVLLVAILLLIISSTTRSYAVSALVTLGIPTLWSGLFLIGQTLLVKCLFLGDRNEDSKFIEVRHRRLYNWFGFVLFFYNSFAGLVSAIIRIAINVVFGILLVFRLDIQILPSHLWWWDFNHKAYQGYIYMHYCYNNPVMHVFSHLLVKSVRQTQSLDAQAEVELVGADALVKTSQNTRARNRWLVAYTLIKNPSLQKHTAKNIALLANQQLAEKQKVFVLDHVIKNVAEDEDLKQMLKTKKEISDAKSEESTGVEVLTGNFRKTVEDFGEDVVPICPSDSLGKEE